MYILYKLYYHHFNICKLEKKSKLIFNMTQLYVKMNNKFLHYTEYICVWFCHNVLYSISIYFNQALHCG